MKLLIIHNKYRNLGGEDIAVDNEVKFLEKHFEINTLYFSNNNNNLSSTITSLLLNRNHKLISILKKEINHFQPDYVYVHNTWFFISLGIFSYLKKNNIKTLVKLHNFRYDCTRTYFLKNHLRGKKFCNACGINKSKALIFNKYFEESFIKSFFMIKYGKKYFRIINDSFIKILVLTDFHKNYLIKLGIDKEKIFTFPNKIEEQNFQLNKIKDKYIVYAGRISEEKGVEDLIYSFKSSNLEKFKLKIVGDGPKYDYLKSKYSNESIEFLGLLSNHETLNLIYYSECVVTATKLLEGQPTLLCEASILGIPSIFPKTGGIAEFFPEDYKLSFNQFDYEDLTEKLNLLEDTKYLINVGNENKKYIEDYLNEKKLIADIESIVDE
tara:strand:+ start:15148 stop:16293 length:1146 start_codon:yes stop_codon:yes gene_type:complete